MRKSAGRVHYFKSGLSKLRINNKTVPSTSRKSERGATLILLTFMIATVVIPLVGLAIDGSIAYWLKGKLSASVDAAALAAGRSLSVGQTQPQQLASATQAAQQYFAANFQPGTMGTVVVGGQPTVSVTPIGLHLRSVTVQATATAPLYFMPILGFNTATVAATGESTRRDANIVLIIDRSGSMSSAGACGTMIASAQNFVNDFVDGRDQLGLVSFQTTASVDYPATLKFKSNSPSLNSVLGTTDCIGSTSTAQALQLAYDQIKNVIKQPGALNVIVLFTDGQPNSFVGNFAIKKVTDTRYGWQATSTLTSTPPSTCNPPVPVTGVLVSNNPVATGQTSGLYDPGPVANDVQSTKIVSSPGCVFPGNTDKVRLDLAALPAADVYGNSTAGYKPNDPVPAGNPPYTGLSRIDAPISVVNAALNAADNQARTIRTDPIYTPIIYTIGLGGTPFQVIDSDFLERVANDPRASSYNSKQPTGLFIYANASTLGSAFAQIASQILRLSK